LNPGNGSWIYGATENPNGTSHIDAGQFNGGWTAQGSWSAMLNDFTFQYNFPTAGKFKYPVNPYAFYKCETTANSTVGAASTTANNNAGAGYDLIGNNCLDAAIRVLNAYGAPNVEGAFGAPGPNWWFDHLDGSTWNITGGLGETWRNYNSGQLLDLTGPNTNDGTAIHQWTYTGADNQWWIRNRQSDGATQLFSRYDSKCVGVTGGSTAVGAAVVQWDCDRSANQEWYFRPTGQTGSGGWPVYNIVNKNSGLCLGVTGGSTSVGANTVQWTCNGHPDQGWY
jgi:hypothetical protein